ncbi:MAG: hypothetical protein ACE5R4_04100 [Armatimonadota bacterium]
MESEKPSGSEAPTGKRGRLGRVWLVAALLLLALLVGGVYELRVLPGKVAVAYAKREMTRDLDAIAGFVPGSKPLADEAKRFIEKTEMSVERVEPGLNQAVVHIKTDFTFAGQTVSFTQPVCLDRQGLTWKVNTSRTMQQRVEAMQEAFRGVGGVLQGLMDGDEE